MRRRFLSAAAAALCIAPAAWAGAGDLDPAFGAGGVTLIGFGSGADRGEALAVQQDGRIVAAGAAFNGTDEDFAVVRILFDGSLDPSFGSGGRVITPIGSEDDHANAIAIQDDGRILVAGQSKAGGVERFAIVRYDTNGALDASFGAGGIVVSAYPGPAGIAGMTLQADQKIVVAGAHDPALLVPAEFALERYNANGTLDPTFGTGGRAATTIQTAGNGAAAVLVQPDGKLVATGIAATFLGSTFATVRYNANGTLDGTFAAGGIAQTSVGPGFAGGLCVARQADGKLVVGGGRDGSSAFVLVRYLQNGTLDATFATGGIGTTPHNGPAVAIAVEPDGRLAAAGGIADFGLARFAGPGALDGSFGSGGLVTTTTGGGAKGIARQADGMLVVVGTNANGADADFEIARYQGLSEPVAFCQGTDASCPCGQGGLATTGCQNAQMTGGVELSAASYLPNGLGGGSVVLTGSNFPAMLSPAAVLIRSLGAETPPVVFGNGLRCISLGGLLRISARLASGGSVTMNLSHGAGGGNFHYQLWFRDQPASFCDPAAAFNLSNGLSIPW